MISNAFEVIYFGSEMLQVYLGIVTFFFVLYHPYPPSAAVVLNRRSLTFGPRITARSKNSLGSKK